MYRLILLLTMFVLNTSVAFAQSDARPAPFMDVSEKVNEFLPSYVRLNSAASEMMFDRQDFVTNKATKQLLMRQDGALANNALTLGGRFNGVYMNERTNTAGKFPILSRLPPTHTSGKRDGYFIVNDAAISATLTLPYVLAYAQGEYTELAYTGQERQDWRKYFVTIGDLDKFPVYLTFGKKTVSFGNMDSYAPFTHGHNAHYFWAQNDDPLFELGYLDHGWHVTASMIKNDRGKRVINSPEGKNGYQNFALNATKEIDLDINRKVKLGAGFLRGSIYDSTLAHHPPVQGLNDRDWAPVWNVNAVYSTEKYDVMAEFTRTIDEWPATDARVHALNVQGRYRDNIWKFPTTYSLMYSQGIQGDSGDEWERMDQVVTGIEMKLHPNVTFGAEYLINSGFVPLIRPTIVADDGVVSHTFLTGLKITF